MITRCSFFISLVFWSQSHLVLNDSVAEDDNKLSLLAGLVLKRSCWIISIGTLR